MDYEKAYNEALQLARTYYDKGTNEFLDTIFPELRDIEDERIRKAIKCYVEDMPDTYGFAHWIGKKEMLSYLEKQKINTDGDFGRGYNCGYECCLNSHGAEWFEKQKEQKAEPFSCGHENGSSEEPVLPGIEEPGIPGKDFIPVEWMEACEKYGKWKIVKQEQPELNIDTIRDWSIRFTPDIRQEVEATAYHFWNMALNAIKEESK